MASSPYYLGIDIGSSTTKVAVGIFSTGRFSLVKLLKFPTRGVKRGLIDDIKEATSGLNPVLSELKTTYPGSEKNIFLSIGSAYINSRVSQGIVAVARADFEIGHDDIDRAISSASAMRLPINRTLIGKSLLEYIVDGVGEIHNPLGMIGNRLESRILLIDVFTPVIKNIEKALESNGGVIRGHFYSAPAAAESVLTEEKKEEGCLLIDLGAHTTSLSVFEEGRLLHTAILPFGSYNITNDLAIGLKTSLETAEMIKYSFGAAYAKDASPKENIDLKRLDIRLSGKASRRFIAQIIEARLMELLESIVNELEKAGRVGKLPAGVILVGGGAKLPGILDLFREELGLVAELGLPRSDLFLTLEEKEEGSGDKEVTPANSPSFYPRADDPEFATTLGLLDLGLKGFHLHKKSSASPFKNFLLWLADHFLP